MTRWLGIDHGTKRIGVAVGNTSDGIATPLAVLDAQPPEEVIEQVLRLAEQYQAEGMVVGWPLNMDDSEGPQGRSARKLAELLARRSGGDVRLWDERLSSFEADGVLAGKLTRKKRKRRQDAVAAAVILQDFFARGGPDAAPKITEAGLLDERPGA